MGFFGSVANWVEKKAEQAWDGAKDAGEWVGDKAEDVWHGTEEVAKDTWDWTKDEGRRIGDGGVTLYNNVKEGGKALLSDFGEGMGHVGNGMFRMAQGDFSAGGAEFGKGVAQATVGGVVDAGAFILAGSISAVQVIGHIEPLARPLTEHEIEILKPIYGNSIDYSQVRIKEGGGLLTEPHHSRTVGNTVYMSLDHNDPRFEETLVHEMGHVWQFQNGGADYLHKALASQAFGSAYLGREAALEEKPWESLSPEDQADLLAEFFRAGFPATLATFSVPDSSGNLVDRTAYANKVLEQVQRGLGATT